MNRKYQKSSIYLPKASFSQNLDEHKIVQVHPLDLRNDVTFDRSILSTSLTLPFYLAAITTSFPTLTDIPRYSSNRRSRGQSVCFVLLSMVVK